ncbi:DUF1796 family putative cysteine peptidase [Leptolyngbya ohadii]|uniref:DUF1796 family putative cysteine peptidase n=1 Tax=Leptolyngbya ohadii TaxID=1962290 RepID=UPI000B59C425|nr:DUF1796 family putative cysteine peptidase [Leptolyngbya ohadii]
MYRFQISAVTKPGETIALVGSIPEMGFWDISKCVRLQTQSDRYPLWWVDLELDTEQRVENQRVEGDRSFHFSPAEHQAEDKAGGKAEDKKAEDKKAEYKYVRIRRDGSVEWEAWGANRWVPIETASFLHPITVEDGTFGTIPPYPYGYIAEATPKTPVAEKPAGLKIAVIGSSVALGCSAWLLDGWAWQLGQELQRLYGHQLVNLSQIGTNVSQTIARFAEVVSPEQPDIVIIALSLGNEGLASCPRSQQQAIQQHFEDGLQQLIQMTRNLGAYPILGGVYPNGNYLPEHYALLRETHERMLTWDVPVLGWLETLDDGQGRWKAGTSFDIAHPNTRGHQLMAEAIDLSLFDPEKLEQKKLEQSRADGTADLFSPEEISIYRDDSGFEVFINSTTNGLHIKNNTTHCYSIAPHWQTLQAAIRKAKLQPGVYIAENVSESVLKSISKSISKNFKDIAESISEFISEDTPEFISGNLTEAPIAGILSLLIQEDGTIATPLSIPTAADLIFHPVSYFTVPGRSQTIFHEGQLFILKVSDRRLYIINESEHEYNIHPMWKGVRAALKAMPSGVYEDPTHPDAPFRTMMIGNDGLESRVKAAPHSAIVLEYQCSLSEVSRIAILPLGDRCAVRMLLYKLEYDGPAFPFDLTRTTNLADVADIVQNDFSDMWNPGLLHYSPDAGRIYHTRWSGLSFAHEVEDSDDPVHDMFPVYERMRVRYAARASRFRYTLQHCDKVLFIRTGCCDRGAVVDLLQKLEAKCQGKSFHLLLISPQDSNEFANLPNVLHHNLEFNPDRMYEDRGHWLYCTEIMGGILDSLGVSSKNLFWCPPHV